MQMHLTYLRHHKYIQLGYISKAHLIMYLLPLSVYFMIPVLRTIGFNSTPDGHVVCRNRKDGTHYDPT